MHVWQTMPSALGLKIPKCYLNSLKNAFPNRNFLSLKKSNIININVYENNSL